MNSRDKIIASFEDIKLKRRKLSTTQADRHGKDKIIREYVALMYGDKGATASK